MFGRRERIALSGAGLVFAILAGAVALALAAPAAVASFVLLLLGVITLAGGGCTRTAAATSATSGSAGAGGPAAPAYQAQGSWPVLQQSAAPYQEPVPQYPQQYAPAPQQFPPPQQYPPVPPQQPPYQDPYQQQYYQQPPPYQPSPYQQPQYQQPQDEQPQYQQPIPPPPVQSRDSGGGILRRLGQLVSKAGYIAGASGRMQRDVENIELIRKPIAITRTVAVLSPARESGTSVVTMLLSDVLAAQRPDNVLAVDTDPQQNELSHHLEPTLGSAAGTALKLVRCDATAEALRETLGNHAGGASRTGVAVIDCAGDLNSEVSTHLALTAHALVVVIPSPRQQAAYCLDQLSNLASEAQQLLVQRAVLVVNVIDGSQPDWIVDWLRERGLLTVVLGYDGHLANAWPFRPDALQPASRRTTLELAARVVERATR